MTIKIFSIEYDAINSTNTFTNGDTIKGRIILEVSKETKVQSLIFRAKGNAKVRWIEHHCVYWADENYYDVKHHILREARQDGTEIIGKGRHEFPFSFKIPKRKIPSSFKSPVGNIVHKLTAELKQSMKITKKTKTHFRFVSKAYKDIPRLKEPQHGSKDKSVKTFGSGNISMDVHTKRMGYQQGKAVEVVVEIKNLSTRSVKPKFILYETQSFFAQGHRRVYKKDIIKEKTKAVESSGKDTVTKLITIPRDLPPSILNCSIIKLEYRLKVYLDIKYAPDPEIKLPIIVLPSSVIPAKRRPSATAAAGFGFESYGNLDQACWSTTSQPPTASQADDPPPPYGAYAVCPSNNIQADCEYTTDSMSTWSDS